MPDKAVHLGLMHRKDHRRGSAGATERVADIGNVEDRGSVAAELRRNLNSKKFFPARRVDGRLWEARIAIDFLRLGRGCGCDSCRPLQEGTPIEQELFACLVRGRAEAPCVWHVHRRYASRICDLREHRAHATPDRLSSFRSSLQAKDLIQM